MFRAVIAALLLLTTSGWAQQPDRSVSDRTQPNEIIGPPIPPEIRAREAQQDIARRLAIEEQRRFAAEQERRRNAAQSGICCAPPLDRSTLHLTVDEKETACIAAARAVTPLPATDRIIVVSGDAARGRAIVRLSWNPSGAPRAPPTTFACTFESNALATASFESTLLSE